jgi:L,D-peptidoglycan transpeptidase YkuD (ErfK/YbiS/YcfS/YnhG family)
VLSVAPAPRAVVAAGLLAAPSAVTTSTAPAPPVPGASRYNGRLPGNIRQIIVVSARRWSTTYGVVTLWQRWGFGWRKLASWSARLGYGGLVLGTRRVQSTGTTPAGAYSITETFGRLADPGTAMHYVKVTDDDWWVEDRRSIYYNRMRKASLGGFAVTTSGYNGSEHLLRMGAQYDYVAVINFNRPRPVIGRGAGIFLHAFGTGATGGCVSIRHDRMRTTLRWLRPDWHPWILIGPTSWLNP